MRRIAARAAHEGITPLDVMLTAMREDWEAAQAMLRDEKPGDPAEAEKWTSRIMKLREAAVATADRVAPYLHPRLANVTGALDVTNHTPEDTRPPFTNFLAEFGSTGEADAATKH